MQFTNLKAILTLLAVAILTGCAGAPLVSQQGNPNIYTRGQTMSPGHVVEGTVLQSRKVQIAAGSTMTGLGASIGGVLGAVAANKKGYAVQSVGALLGAVAGGALGNAAGKTEGNEIVVQLADNSLRVIVQEPGAVAAVAGERVLLLINGSEARVVGRL